MAEEKLVLHVPAVLELISGKLDDSQKAVSLTFDASSADDPLVLLSLVFGVLTRAKRQGILQAAKEVHQSSTYRSVTDPIPEGPFRAVSLSDAEVQKRRTLIEGALALPGLIFATFQSDGGLPYVRVTLTMYALDDSSETYTAEFSALWDSGCQITTICRDLIPERFQAKELYSGDIRVHGYREEVTTAVAVRERATMPNSANILILGQYSFISGMVVEWRGSSCAPPSSQILLHSFQERSEVGSTVITFTEEQ